MTIDSAALRAVLERARREVDAGLLPSCQIALALEGELVAFETFGDADDDTRYAVYSATKAFVAGAMWALIGDGLVERLPQRGATPLSGPDEHPWRVFADPSGNEFCVLAAPDGSSGTS